MIETLTARSGCKVLRYKGKLLSSAVDPVGEAEEWLKRRLTLLARVKTVFVLGAGSGYHIEEVCRQTSARVIVIEKDSALTSAVQEIHGFNAIQIRFEEIEGTRDLRASETIRQAVAESFLVLEHAASVAAHPEFYAEIKNQLLGRDWGSLTWQWQLKDLAPLDSQAKIHGAALNEPLTIYDLDKTELVQDSAEREKMLLKALRELVK